MKQLLVFIYWGIIFLTKLYGIMNLASFPLIWLSYLSNPSKNHIFVYKKDSSAFFSDILIPLTVKMFSSVTPTVLSFTTLSKIYMIQTYMPFIHFVYLLLEISGFYLCVYYSIIPLLVNSLALNLAQLSSILLIVSYNLDVASFSLSSVCFILYCTLARIQHFTKHWP